VEDCAQSIYIRRRSYLQDTGLCFQGRSIGLSHKLNKHRTIVKFAWGFYREHSIVKIKVVNRDLEGEVIAPQSTKRIGPVVGIIKAKNFFEEMRVISRLISKLITEKKIPGHEILILYLVKRTHKYPIIELIKKSLSIEKLDYFWITENDKSNRNFEKEDGKIKMSTIDSSKGLDY
jgi:hypothetical protein